MANSWAKKRKLAKARLNVLLSELFKEKVSGYLHTTTVFPAGLTRPTRRRSLQEIQVGDVCARSCARRLDGRSGIRDLVFGEMGFLNGGNLAILIPFHVSDSE